MTRPPLAEIPTRPVPVPPAVRSLVDASGGGALVPVWVNDLGGLTFRWGAGGTGGTDRYVKWVAAGTPEIDLLAEAERLAWASRFVTVPRVLDAGQDEAGAWLVTEAIDAASAVDPRWIEEPATAAAAIGRGLRVLHDALPVDDCPFEWSVEQRIARADERIADGEGPADWFPEHAGMTIAQARPLLDLAPPVDRLVVCHGDACAPNTLLAADGSFAAHVDLGSLGVADRWADLAVAAWSTEWNHGPGYDGIVYEAYGIEPDLERIAYYRLLWDLG